MIPLLSFDGQLKRPAYAMASLGAFFSQHLLVAVALALLHQPLATPWWFWISPLRTFVGIATVGGGMPMPLLLVAMGLTLLVGWVLAALAFRRTRDAGRYDVLAALALVPAVQIPVILWLSLAPSGSEPASPLAAPETTPSPADSAATRPELWSVVEGLLLGMAISVGVVALGAVVMRTYGYALFLGAPLLIGLAVAYVANRKVGVGTRRTLLLIVGALTLGGVALLGVALEGIVCLILASPIIGAAGVVGGLFGQALARRGHRGRRTTLASVAVLPLLLAAEALLPPKAGFESLESVDVAAPPAAVWDAVVHMGPIPDAPAPPFRWGLAYPLRGVIHGQGVGAIREGVFSTGVAYERVTQWQPERKLSFIVLSDPPTMRELSPYQTVHAPHVSGYFRTLDARFTITPLADGRTRLTLATRHELDLEPALYWVPLARWAVHANKVRVLANFQHQAEAAAAKPRAIPAPVVFHKARATLGL